LKTDRQQGRRLFLLRATCVCVYAVCGLVCLLAPISSAQAENQKRSQFSREEISWAVTWINSALPHFMQKGIIAKISTKDEGFAVFAGKPWYQLTFTQQGEFLKNLSRSREIIGHPPQFSIVDIDSSATIARVSGSNIEILTPAEGFKYYQPQAEDAATTSTTTAD
jgi:hypothetical protein